MNDAGRSGPFLTQVLRLPCAHGDPVIRGRLRAVPEDFVVREWLGFAADGEGDHWLLTVRKRGANTHWVAKQLAKLAHIHPRDVGFAGLKDRNAVTEQAFTIPVRTAMTGDWLGVTGEGFEVIGAVRHRRKLKRGALRGNDFAITVREFAGDLTALEDRIQAIANLGVPNYFGPQRFGREGANLSRAQQWLSGKLELEDRLERGFALSAARSALFNAVAAQRVDDGTWQRLRAGDVANLDGSNSIFAVAALDAVLEERCQRLDIHPTGPLWGQGPLASQGAVADLERQVCEQQPVLATGLARCGLEQERRALRMRVGNIAWSVADGNLLLNFRLPRGTFATAVLHELLEGAFTEDLPDAGEE